MNDIERFCCERSLVSVHRDGVDPNNIQGFILGCSEKLVLLQYVYDFRLDGLMVLRTEDISEMKRTKTDEFQQSLLVAEGALSHIPFDYSIDLTSWRRAISGLRSDFSLLIMECELTKEPAFALGEILEVGDEEVVMRTFSGTANWDEDTSLCRAKTLRLVR